MRGHLSSGCEPSGSGPWSSTDGFPHKLSQSIPSPGGVMEHRERERERAHTSATENGSFSLVFNDVFMPFCRFRPESTARLLRGLPRSRGSQSKSKQHPRFSFVCLFLKMRLKCTGHIQQMSSQAIPLSEPTPHGGVRLHTEPSKLCLVLSVCLIPHLYSTCV